MKLVGRSWFVEMANTTESKVNAVAYMPGDLHSLISKNTEETNLRLSFFASALWITLNVCKYVLT